MGARISSRWGTLRCTDGRAPSTSISVPDVITTASGCGCRSGRLARFATESAALLVPIRYTGLAIWAAKATRAARSCA